MSYPGATHTKRTHVHSGHSMALASCPPGLDRDGSSFLAHLICPLMMECGLQSRQSPDRLGTRGPRKCLQRGRPLAAAEPAGSGVVTVQGSLSGSELCFHKCSYASVALFLVGLTGFKEVCGGTFLFPGRQVRGRLLTE